MSKISCAVFLSFIGAGFAVGLAVEEVEKRAKYPIKQVMKEAHKDGLWKKVTEGKGSKEEKARLLELYTSLWDNAPPKGDEASWTKKTGTVVVAAAKVLLEQDKAVDELKGAVNCKACHDTHKG
ncbi:MAG TPA: hypothetical protein VMT52_18860 [Planctomycetota bacterium]|nr:hypothetical protein [Planctomycetota bacterium]